MQYVIYNVPQKKYIRTATSSVGYTLTGSLPDATFFDWDKAADFYLKRISKSKKNEFCITRVEIECNQFASKPEAAEPAPVPSAPPVPIDCERPDGSHGICFMVDYENVKESGLVGAEYLTDEDRVTLFYSVNAKYMTKRNFVTIVNSNCAFDICALANTGKNALDFYLTSRMGEVFGSGYAGPVCIVSNDNGFNAVTEYWSNRAYTRHTVTRADNFATGILYLDGRSRRADEIRELSGRISIETEYARYNEWRKSRRALAMILRSIGCLDRLDETEALINATNVRKTIYVQVLHIFGKAHGLEVYNQLKLNGFV